MLNTMRDLSKSLVSKLLMLLLVVSFGIWGIGDIARNQGSGYAIKVGHEKISIPEFQQQRSQMARQLEAVGIKDFPENQLIMSVIQKMVQEKLSLMAMRDMGLVVNEELIAKTIADMPDFKDKNGKFDAAAFKAAVSSRQLNEKALVSQIKRVVAGRFLTESLAMHDAVAPNSMLTLEAMVAGETRDAVIFTIAAADASGAANEEALKAYYEENKAIHYMLPERRTLEYVVLTQPEIDAFVDQSITEEMLAEAAKAKPDLAKPLLRMKLKTEQRDGILHTLGNSIEDELAAGKTMAEAFAKAGITATPRTLADATADQKTSADDVISNVVEQGFSLGEGEISRLIRSKKGTLLMVATKKIIAAEPQPYEAVKAEVKTRFAKQSMRDAAQAKAVKVKEALASAPNWQSVAEEQRLSSRAVSRITRPADGKSRDLKNRKRQPTWAAPSQLRTSVCLSWNILSLRAKSAGGR